MTVLIMTAKLPRRKIALCLAAASLMCCCALGIRMGGVPALGALTGSGSGRVTSNQDRIDYLASYGWEVAQQPLATQELLIPEELDETYAESLQPPARASGSSGTPTRSSTTPPGRAACRPTFLYAKTKSWAEKSSPPGWTGFSTGCPCHEAPRGWRWSGCKSYFSTRWTLRWS